MLHILKKVRAPTVASLERNLYPLLDWPRPAPASSAPTSSAGASATPSATPSPGALAEVSAAVEWEGKKSKGRKGGISKEEKREEKKGKKETKKGKGKEEKGS